MNLQEAYATATMGLDLGKVEVDARLPSVEVNVDPMFPKVIYNLIGNSIKHGRKVTRISISCAEIPEGLMIVYEDDGVGIPLPEKEGLFDRGSKASGQSHGLFLSAEILKITGILIEETGEPGKGARFKITVPRDRFRVDG